MQQLSGSTIIQFIGLFLLILASLLVLISLFRKPQNISLLSSHPAPVQDYAEAAQRIETLHLREPAGMNPDCTLQFLTHGKKVNRAIVLVHGYTNNARQFIELGRRFHELGYNVLIANLPYHGLADRMNTEHACLTAEQLVTYADETIDIARGLGDQVIMLGLSMGGIVTAWAAQNRPDLDLAVVISPAFGARVIPTPLTAAAMNIVLRLKDVFIWWNPKLKENVPPPYGYPRFSLHVVAQTMRLGFATQARARSLPPAAKKIVVVFNPSDMAVNNALNMQVVKLWQAQHGNVSTYEFEASLNLEHDFIDPSQPNQQVDLVYPRLIDLVES
jgi:pimeloyl-ACP methyl ester carboxylesterase